MNENDIEESPGPEVYKVIGAPGTGKTTRVVGNPDLDLNGLFLENADEYSLQEQMLVTYTNAGVDEAAYRLEKMTDAPRYKIDERVTTIHSRCFKTLSLKREDVVDHWDKKKFCDSHDLNFGWEDEQDDIMGADQQEGNTLFRIYSWLQSNRLDIEEWRRCPADWGFQEDPEFLMKKWDEWKEDRRLIGFGDMIKEVVEMGYMQLNNLGWGVLFPDEHTTTREMFEEAAKDPQLDPDIIRGLGAFIDTKVLYVDEVQDLTALQWEWYLLQKLVCEKVYLGGDDDQSIYGWSGADPEFMLNEEGDFEVLETTYRIPREIWDVCNGVIHQVEHRQEKEVTPNGDGGEFIAMRAPSNRQIIEHILEDNCLVLFRARYHIDEFRDTLHDEGIPYRNMSTYDTWSDDVETLRDGLAKIYNGEGKINGHELDALIEYAEDDMYNRDSGVSESEKVMSHFGGVSNDRMNEIFPFMKTSPDNETKVMMYLDQTDELNYYEKKAIRGNIKNGHYEMSPDRVRIGTIHSSKGKEADTVVLATDTTKTIMQNMYDEYVENVGREDQVANGIAQVPLTDEERRVYYVGMTRAANKLVLAQGVIDPSSSIDLANILDDEYEAGEWESGQQTMQSNWTR